MATGTGAASASIWWMAIRPRTLSMAIVPVAVGAASAVAGSGRFAVLGFLIALAVALAIQIGTNLLNDWRDGESGLDTADRLGPTRVTASGLMKPADVKRMAYIAFGCAAVAGLFAIVLGGVPMLVIGAASLVAGLGYSNGPRPISGTPFGEVFVLAFFGLAAVVGTHWLMTGAWSLTALMCGLQIGLPAAAVLLVNNHRDRVGDAASGRRTLAILLGPERSQSLYGLIMVGACLFGVLVALTSLSFGPLATLAALPLALALRRRIAAEAVGPGLNEVLVRTAQFQVLLGVLLVCGLLIAV
ncbi:1,4-dihydroxy-2-naphthoate octaprenyltransferase [Blastochloris viridis]|nr:1,4-dihydroxy-2-naphthoate octaprenyltransferase [Blastochloris viridis]